LTGLLSNNRIPSMFYLLYIYIVYQPTSWITCHIKEMTDIQKFQDIFMVIWCSL